MKETVRNKMCSRCSCIYAMKEIEYFSKNIPKNNTEGMILDEILSYGELEGELFQCYMDNNGTKCKGLYDFTNYLKNNPSMEDKLRENLDKYKNTMRKERTQLLKLRDIYKKPNATMEELSEIAYNRGQNLDYYKELGMKL